MQEFMVVVTIFMGAKRIIKLAFYYRYTVSRSLNQFIMAQKVHNLL